MNIQVLDDSMEDYNVFRDGRHNLTLNLMRSSSDSELCVKKFDPHTTL